MSSKTLESTSNEDFRSSLDQPTYSETPLRRSLRNLNKTVTKPDVGPLPTSLFLDRKRGSTSLDDGTSQTLVRSPKKQKRGYASPETYEYLNPLQDYLKPELDVIFCGINPGHMSAEVGHHFAHPTNHFWRCLHMSGFTPELISPTLDFTLPESFSLGLTNLVDRPSIQQAELSHAEMVASVPALLKKVLQYRPRVVCFVGLGIWKDVETALLKVASLPKGGMKSSPIPAKSPIPKKNKKKSGSTLVGLQPYKIAYPLRKQSPLHYPKASLMEEELSITETLFFAMPSTSARVISHQLPDKTKIFLELKNCVEDLKQARLDTTAATIILSDSI